MKTIAQRFLIILMAAIGIYSCSRSVNPDRMTGVYRVIIQSPGGDLAFPLYIKAEKDSLSAFVVNGRDTAYFNNVSLKKDSLIAGFDYYDSYLRARVDDGTLIGEWHRRSSGGVKTTMPFKADKGVKDRYFIPQPVPKDYPFEGDWQVTFSDKDGTYPAHGLFVSEPGGKLHGTFLTETGDYRFLDGFFTDSTCTLSTFDGAHAFLFKGYLQPDGSLKGDFWSKNSYHATWIAHKGEDRLRDPMQISADDAVGKKAAFSFPDLNKQSVSASDSTFRNKPMLIYLFGSWCPNCADEAQMLRSMYQDEYQKTDLKVVGLAFEFTGNYNKDANMVERYKRRFNIPWTLLIAGKNDKEAAHSLPFLSRILSYPTTIFVDRNHMIKAIHVGFNGPATGKSYYKEIKRFKDHINEILNS